MKISTLFSLHSASQCHFPTLSLTKLFDGLTNERFILERGNMSFICSQQATATSTNMTIRRLSKDGRCVKSENNDVMYEKRLKEWHKQMRKNRAQFKVYMAIAKSEKKTLFFSFCRV